jgi:hypothetical protein
MEAYEPKIKTKEFISDQLKEETTDNSMDALFWSSTGDN